MSTKESSKQSRPFYWFKFYPHEWIELLSKKDDEAGKRFKVMIERLVSNKAPAESTESKMIEECKVYRERQRERITNYWNARNAEQEQPPEPQQPVQQQMRRPPRPRIPAPQRTKKPTLEEVYDYCDTIGTPPPIGREWYEWQDSKGWNNFTSTWQTALRGFAKKKKE